MGDGAVVLAYHRIGTFKPDPWDMAVSEEHFEEHLQVLTRVAEPRDVEDLEAVGPRGRLRVALTFDDGYRDNVERVLPLLEAYGVPATFMVVAGEVRRDLEFFWDALERLTSIPGPAWERLVGEAVTRGLVGPHWETEPTDPEEGPVGDWSAFALEGSSSPRHRLCAELVGALRRRDAGWRDDQLRTFATVADVATRPRLDRRSVDAQDLDRLNDCALARVGAHSFSHSLLGSRPWPEALAEMRSSRELLEEHVGRRVEHFAFPFGEVSPELSSMAREAGYGRAYGAYGARGASDPYAIGRWVVPDTDGDGLLELLGEAAAGGHA